jgi:hypothetical protein
MFFHPERTSMFEAAYRTFRPAGVSFPDFRRGGWRRAGIILRGCIMDLSHLLAGGAILGVVTACWTRIKLVAWRGINLLIQQIEIQDELTQNALVDYLVRHYKRSASYDKTYGAFNEHTRDGKFGMVPFELLGRRSIIFWKGWLPFFYSAGSKPQQNPAGGAPAASNQDRIFCTLTFLRGFLDAEALIKAACDTRNEANWDVDLAHKNRQRRFFIRHVPAVGNNGQTRPNQAGAAGLAWYHQQRYRLLKHSPNELGLHISSRKNPLEDLIFPKRIKDLIREIRIWRNNKSWYQERGIPWKRGWLCFGPPGTGKTALARAFAEELDMPLFVFNLAELSNNELIQAWGEMQAASPCVALIEDIDNVFHGRENVARPRYGLFGRKKKKKNAGGGNNEEEDDSDGFSSSSLSFDTLLNCLDGVERSEGVFTIITTNDVSKVDPALGQPRRLPDGSVEFISTRPGRIDKAVELTYMEPGDKKLMARRILGEYEDEYLKLLEFVDRFPDLQETPAQFQERCAQAALARFWLEQQEQRREERKVAPPSDCPETVVEDREPSAAAR